MEADEFKGRKAPYAPVSALHEFFAKMRNVGVPPRVDQRFLQKHNIAAGNEWALLSALKFLGIIDQQGQPTTPYRRLQSSDQFDETLKHLVETAYEPLFRDGGATMSADELANYFRVTSSPSQAKNAARFFQTLSKMAGIGPDPGKSMRVLDAEQPSSVVPEVVPARRSAKSERSEDSLLQAKISLLEKLPSPRPDWSASDYRAICEQFLEMLRILDEQA